MNLPTDTTATRIVIARSRAQAQTYADVQKAVAASTQCHDHVVFCQRTQTATCIIQHQNGDVALVMETMTRTEVALGALLSQRV